MGLHVGILGFFIIGSYVTDVYEWFVLPVDG